MLAIRPNEGLCHLFFKIANIHKKIYTAVRWLLIFYKSAEVGNSLTSLASLTSPSSPARKASPARKKTTRRKNIVHDLINLFSLPPTVSRGRPLVDRSSGGKKCRRWTKRLTISALPIKNDLTTWLPRGLSDFSRTNYGGTTEGLRSNFGGITAPPKGGDELNRARCF